MFIFSIITLEIIAQDQKEYPANYATSPRFKALVYYTEHAEKAHVEFALQALEF
ncbi:MAG: ThuA domain-containing protein, partial [Fermentimonas caenicola]